MPDKVFKPDEVRDEETEMTVTNLGSEEKFAGKVLKSLKEKIDEARAEMKKLNQEIEEKTGLAEEKAEEIKNEARREAEQIKEEAEEEAQEIIQARESKVEEARQEGYEEGYEDGQQEARSDTAQMIARGEEILSEAQRERESYLLDHRDELVRLARHLAEHIVRKTVEVDEEVAGRVVADALDEISEVKEISLVLHPDDYALVEEVIENEKQEHPSLTEITLVEDSRLEPGGCLIRTDFGDLDATVEGQLDHLSGQLLTNDAGK
ncbi:MAG: FliH/SctL family protein [bacterium]